MRQNLKSEEHEININCYDTLQIYVLSLSVPTLLVFSCLHLCTRVSYVTCNTDLNLYSRKYTLHASQCTSTLSLIMLWLLLFSKCEKEQVLLFIVRTNHNIGNIVIFSKIISRVISGTLSFYIFSISLTTCTLCLIIFKI